MVLCMDCFKIFDVLLASKAEFSAQKLLSIIDNGKFLCLGWSTNSLVVIAIFPGGSRKLLTNCNEQLPNKGAFYYNVLEISLS